MGSLRTSRSLSGSSHSDFDFLGDHLVWFVDFFVYSVDVLLLLRGFDGA